MILPTYFIVLTLGQQTIAPLPKVFFQNDTTFALGNLSFTCQTKNKQDCKELVTPMFNFYENLMFPSGKPQQPPKNTLKLINKLIINIETNQLPVDFKHNNETHQIVVNESGIFIDAYNSFGVARALSSISQLVYSNYTKYYKIEESYVNDAPVYPYRAVMVDSSRHFLPISTLKRQVNAISIAKMSILHLHEPDSQSFPTLVDSEPAKNFVKGAWSTNGVKYYHTLQDLYELAEYAKNLGVFLLLEFDMPGHASSWHSADPSIVCSCRDVINPANQLTFDYIRSFIRDLYKTIYLPFGFNPMIHLGGDEVNQGCFSNDPDVSQFMQTHGFTNRDAWKYLHQQVVDIIIEETKAMYPNRNLTEFTRIYWQESFSNNNNMSHGGIVHAWLSTHPIQQAGLANISVVRSQGWYLDVNQAGSSKEAFVDGWMDFYTVDPAISMNAETRKYALGGGPCQWGEKVHNWNIDEQIWPRTIAAAEVLWSEPANRTITDVVKVRLNRLTCKLRQSGVASGALIPSEPCPGIDDRSDGKVIPNWRGQQAQENPKNNKDKKRDNKKPESKPVVVNPFDINDLDEMGWAGRKK